MKAESIVTTAVIADPEKLAVERDEGSLSHVIDPVRERALVRKLDWRLLPVLTFAYIACFVDRASVGNARIMGMQQELHLVGYRFNIVFSRQTFTDPRL
jgi:hypothetical protein